MELDFRGFQNVSERIQDFCATRQYFFEQAPWAGEKFAPAARVE